MTGSAERLLTGRAVAMAARPTVAILRMVEECMSAVMKVLLVVNVLVWLWWTLLVGEDGFCCRRAWWSKSCRRAASRGSFVYLAQQLQDGTDQARLVNFCGHVMKQCRV